VKPTLRDVSKLPNTSHVTSKRPKTDGNGSTPRNYSTGITYSPFGGLSQERLGTSTPIYNKLFYNIRGQLGEIREGLTPDDTSWQRGAIINHYSNGYGCSGASCNAPDNNGNLMTFLCGTTEKTDDYRLVHMGEILNSDESLRSIADLPPGWSASRKAIDSPWQRYLED
jgi:hypothetical protein